MRRADFLHFLEGPVVGRAGALASRGLASLDETGGKSSEGFRLHFTYMTAAAH